MSRPDGNAGRDALKFGELVAVRRTTTPSQAGAAASKVDIATSEGVETGRARPKLIGEFRHTEQHGQGTVRTTNVAYDDATAAKAEVVRKFAAGNGVRVRAPVIPIKTCRRHVNATVVSRWSR
jgi:hypothetical protein